MQIITGISINLLDPPLDDSVEELLVDDEADLEKKPPLLELLEPLELLELEPLELEPPDRLLSAITKINANVNNNRKQMALMIKC